MAANRPDEPPMDAPLGRLEQSFIEEFLRSRGHDPHRMHELPEARASALLKEASMYAAAKLTEVEARARYLHDIHGTRE